MNKPTSINTYVKDGAIAPYRIVKVGSADLTVAQAAASTAPLLGVSNRLGAPDSADLRCDVVDAGITQVEAGGNVTRGAFVMADANGKAIDATVGMYAVGIALAAAVAGDLFPIQISQIQMANAGA